MVEAVKRLKEFWSKQGIKLRPGLTTEAVTKFEAWMNLSFPADLRDYFLFANGFDGEMDDECISFFSLNEAISESPIWSPPRSGTSRLFAFADYLISSHVYMIELQEEMGLSTPVYVVYDNKPEWVRKVAATFSDFIDGYVKSDHSVLFPK